MALAITFPFNISLGMPLYMMVIMNTNWKNLIKYHEFSFLK
jgi:hypothetical protein